MFHRTLKQLAVAVFAALLCCLSTTRSVRAGEWSVVGAGEVCEDQCDEPRPCIGDCLRRKLQLHCVYARRALCCRYISLPYTQPDSAIYYYPAGGAAGFGNPNCPLPGSYPMTGSIPGYPYNYGYSNSGYGALPWSAAPGSVSIR